MTFDSGLKTREKRVGLIYLPVHVFGLPLALGLLSPLIPDVGRWLPTAVYYGVGLAVLATAMGGYLGRQLGVLARTRGGRALSVLLGLLLWLGLTLLLGIILALLPEAGSSALRAALAENNPNNQELQRLLAAAPGWTAVFALAGAPVVEEVLFRGVLFGALRPRSRGLAYGASALLFGVYHVWQYAVTTPAGAPLLLWALAYLPAGLALCRCMERSGTVWACVGMHIVNNALALALLGR